MIRVQREDFDPGAEMDGLLAGRTDLGALVTFLGTVRSNDKGDHISALTLEHYPGMTEAALSDIAERAQSRFSLSAKLIIHRIGRLVPGERIVFVAAAAPHRQDAFEACAFMMDYLKTDAPFWKREEGAFGTRWVKTRKRDAEDRARWE